MTRDLFATDNFLVVIITGIFSFSVLVAIFVNNIL